MSEKLFDWSGRRENDPAHRRIAEFLVMDIQHSPEWVQELAAKIDAVKSGKLSTWERIGNAFRLEISQGKVTIEDLVDDSATTEILSLEELQAAVLAWYQQIN